MGRTLPSQPSLILAGLIAGFAAGVIASTSKNPTLERIIHLLQPAGTFWINALQITVLPLVLSLLVTSIVAACERGKLGGLAGRALLMCLLLYLAVAAATMVVTPPLLSGLRVTPGLLSDPASSAILGEESSVETSSPTDWLTRVTRGNPLTAAAHGDILALFVLFTLFAFALTLIEPTTRGAVVRFFKAIGDVMLALVRWLLIAAPIAIFAVVAPLTGQVGIDLVGAVVYYVALLSGLCVVFTLPLYAVASYFGRLSFWESARATAPIQAVALSTQSSLASLPAMFVGAETRLGSRPEAVGIVLPLVVTVFRYSTPIWLIVATLFVARLSGTDLASDQLMTVAGLSVLMSIAGIGLPSGASYFGPITPIFVSVGLPADAIAVLFAVDTIPDMVETAANVTADMAVVAATARVTESH